MGSIDDQRTGRPVARALLAGLVAASVAGCAPDRPAASPAVTAPAVTSPAVTAVRLLPAVQAYVDAVNAADLEALVRSFAADAEIIDVSRSIKGRAAIRAWADREVIGGRLSVTRVAEERPGRQRLLVHWAPAGSDGWAAFYTFTAEDGLITAADLQYA